MRRERCQTGYIKPSDAEFKPTTEAPKDLDTERFTKPMKDDRRNKNNRKALEELKKEAQELLSLTYSISMDNPKDNPKLLETPKLNISDETKEAIEAGWQGEFPPKACKLISGPEQTKKVETDKLLGATTSDPKMSNPGNITTVDVISPVPHLERPISYPLDLSINDFSRSSPLVANATRESYREMLIALQQKYTVILRMFEEVNEQRMSYIEGLHELQGNLDNARSVMQLQKAEITKLRTNLDACEVSLVNKDKEIEYIRDVLSVHIYNEEDQQSELRYKQECLEEMEREMANLRGIIDELTTKVQELSFMPKIKNNPAFAELNFTYMEALQELEELMKLLSNSETSEEDVAAILSEKVDKTGPLKYLEATANLPLTVMLVELYKKRFEIEEKFNRDLSLMREAKDREIERNNEITQQLVDTYAARVHQANADSLNARNLLDAYTRRTTQLPANIVEKSKINEKIFKYLRHPNKIKILEKTILGKHSFRDSLLCVVNKVVKIGELKRGNFIPKHSFSIDEILKVDFGFMSSSYLLHHSLVKQQVIYPWQFFSIITAQKEYCLACMNDDLIDMMIIGFNRMIVTRCFNVTIVEISAMRLLRAKMKLHYHCVTNKISRRKMWLNAIQKTIEAQKKSR